MSNVRDVSGGKYLRVHCNAGVTYTNNIGNLPGYSDTVWYNPNGISNILSLGLLRGKHLVTYNSQDRNRFVIHSAQRPKFNMTKVGLFYHNMRQLLKNKKNSNIMVNNPPQPPPCHKWRKQINNTLPMMQRALTVQGGSRKSPANQ